MLPEDISRLSAITSLTNSKFSYEFQQKVSENYCPWINITLFPECEQAGKASASQGVIGSIFYIQQGLTKFIQMIDAIPPGLLRIVTMLSNPEVVELFNTVYYGIVPALNYLIDERASNLVEILDKGANDIVKFSIVGVFMAVLILMAITFYVYPRFVAERRIICKTLLLIPPQLLVRNKVMREFLIKDSTTFHSFVKDNLVDNNSFVLNYNTIKERRLVKVIVE